MLTIIGKEEVGLSFISAKIEQLRSLSGKEWLANTNELRQSKFRKERKNEWRVKVSENTN